VEAQQLAVKIRKLRARIAYLQHLSEPMCVVKIGELERTLQPLMVQFNTLPDGVRATISLDFDPKQYHFKPPRDTPPKSKGPSILEKVRGFQAEYKEYVATHAAAPKPQKLPPRPAPKGRAPPPKVLPHQPIPPRPVAKSVDEALLARQGITTKKEWKNWMITHHPDKNPDCDINLVQEVCAAAQRMFR
jgi:hypothetical protein